MILLGLLCVNSSHSCAGIDQFRLSIDEAVAGDNVGILVALPKAESVERGMVMCKTGTCAAYTTFDAEVRIVLSQQVNTKR